MGHAYGILLALHILVAVAALASFWGAVLSRKGGRLHRLSGRAFVASMSATAASASVLCLLLMAEPLVVRPPEFAIAAPDLPQYSREVRELGSGLFALSLATGALLHFGVGALRRRRIGGSRSDVVIAALVAAGGIALFALGLLPACPDLEGDGIIVAIVGALELRALRRRHRSETSWLGEHLFGMVGAGGVAHGALVVNLAGLFTDDLGLAFVASAPVLPLFAIGGAWAHRRWRGKLAASPLERSRAPASLPVSHAAA